MITEITYQLEPGYIYTSPDKVVIRTVLGSCVAVCLWDRDHAVGGMNHYLYPLTKDKNKATAQYGNVSTLMLIKLMKEMGCRTEAMVAQVFGGATHKLNSKAAVGDKNVAIARKILKKFDIPIISEDVGGTMGRKIVFDTESGEVAVLKVHQLRHSDWVEQLPDKS